MTFITKNQSRSFTCFVIACFAVGWLMVMVSKAQAFAILMYHRVGEDSIPSTNVTIQQFQSHINLIKELGYQVLPLQQVMDDVANGKTWPEHAVAITLDDAYGSFYRNAWPLLRKENMPFTLFFSTDLIGDTSGEYMSWEDIKNLKNSGLVGFGGHGHSHGHMTNLSPEAALDDIRKSQELVQQELGQTLTLFAYPYGEASEALYKVVKQAGYQFAFGQHSGIASLDSYGSYYLPRFALSQNYADKARLVTALKASVLPMKDVLPSDPLLGQKTGDNPPLFGFTYLGDDNSDLNRLRCYFGSGESTQIQILGSRVEIRFASPFGKGRTRVNCTLAKGDGAFMWFGQQFYLP